MTTRRRNLKVKKRYTSAAGRPQDEVEWDEAKQDAEPCPACGHFFTMAMESKEEVDGVNQSLKEAHDKEMLEFNSLGENEKKNKRKPSKRMTRDQTIGCYCFKMNCLLQKSGGTCQSCQLVSQAGGSMIVKEEQ